MGLKSLNSLHSNISLLTLKIKLAYQKLMQSVSHSEHDADDDFVSERLPKTNKKVKERLFSDASLITDSSLKLVVISLNHIFMRFQPLKRKKS